MPDKNIPEKMLTVEDLEIKFELRGKTLNAIRGISLDLYKGEILAIVGESGSGKTTLLSLLAGLDVADEGSILVEGEDLRKMNRDRYRRDVASVVYQSFQLFPLLTARENVMYPMEMKKLKKKEAVKRAQELLLSVGLTEKIYKQFPLMMSGGEQQRVALARALVNNPDLIIADEPTGNIDPELSFEIVELLHEINKMGTTIVMVTHEHELVSHFNHRVITIENGTVVSDTPEYQEEAGYL